MGNELQSGATLKFSADPRLAAAAAGVARYLADSAGMEAEASAKLQAATLATCVAEFPYLRGAGAQLSVDVSRFADRIEIVVTDSRTTAQHGGSLPGVDKIEHETHGSSAITRLIKFIAQS